MTTVQERIAQAPLPTESELRRRSNPVVQFFRFVSLAFSILLLARKHG